MLNHIDIMGRLVKDPELRTTNNGKKVVTFTIACDRDLQDVTDFFDCVAWEKTGEFVQKHFFKGKMAIVSGSAQIRKYEDRDGNKRTSWEINASRVYFGDDKRRDDGFQQMDGGPVQYAAKPDPYAEAYTYDSDGRLPF